MKALALVSLLACGAVAQAALPIYSTGFETSENAAYVTGASIDGIDSWKVLNGTATIQATGAGGTAQYVSIGEGGYIERVLPASAVGTTLWVEGYFRGAGSSVPLSDAVYPVSDVGGASAIVHFSTANGIEMLDGNGTGGARAFVRADVPLGEANKDTWYKVSLRLDFSAKTWDIYVDNAKKNVAPLGFRDSSVTRLSGFRNLAQSGSGFDLFRTVVPIRGDANGDGFTDGADLVALVERLGSDLPDPILDAEIDFDGDNKASLGDMTTLQNILAGITR